MKKLKKIKLSNINNPQLEKEQLSELTGGIDLRKDFGCACSDSCAGVPSQSQKYTGVHDAPKSYLT